MKTCFFHQETRAILDLCPYHPELLDSDPLLRAFAFPQRNIPVFLITLINVPTQHRRKKLGTMLLTEALQQAERLGHVLILEPAPSGPLGLSVLVAWYSRHGFRRVSLDPRNYLMLYIPALTGHGQEQ